MSAFIDLDQTVHPQRMHAQELSDLLSDVEKKAQTDPKSAKTLLQLIFVSDISITNIEGADAERRLRKLAMIPLQGISFFKEREEVKKICKELITKWGQKRRAL